MMQLDHERDRAKPEGRFVRFMGLCVVLFCDSAIVASLTAYASWIAFDLGLFPLLRPKHGELILVRLFTAANVFPILSLLGSAIFLSLCRLKSYEPPRFGFYCLTTSLGLLIFNFLCLPAVMSS